MKNCNQPIKATCSTKNYATCIEYQTTLPEFSEIEGCPVIEETTEELYNLVGDIRDQIDLSELGDKCLEYVQEEGKTIVKNVLLAFEEKICELEEEITTLKNRQLCDFPIGDCIDVKCLSDVCSNEITTFGQLIQALVDAQCETP